MIFKDILWNIVSNVLLAIFGIALLLIINKILNPHLIAGITVTLLIVGISSAFDFGLSRQVIKYIATDDEKICGVKKAFEIIGITYSILIIVIYILTRLLSINGFFGELSILDISIIALLPLQITKSSYYLAIAQGHGKFRYYAITKFIGNFGFLISLITVIIFELLWPALLLATILRYLLNKKIRNDFAIRNQNAITLKPFKDCGWLGANAFFSIVVGSADKIIISLEGNASSVATYNTLAEAIGRFGLISGAIWIVLLQKISQIKRNEDIIQKAKIISRYNIIFFLPLFLGLMTLSKLGSEEIFGNPYNDDIIKIMLLSTFAQIYTGTYSNFLLSHTSGKIIALIQAVEFIPMFIAGFLALKFYGLYGLALCMLIRIIIDGLIVKLYFYKTFYKSR